MFMQDKKNTGSCLQNWTTSPLINHQFPYQTSHLGYTSDPCYIEFHTGGHHGLGLVAQGTKERFNGIDWQCCNLPRNQLSKYCRHRRL